MRTPKACIRVSLAASTSLILFSGSAIAQSASGPLNGNYVVSRSSTCSSGVPDATKPLPQVIDWLVGMSTVSQSSVALDSGTYANWLSGVALANSGSVPDLTVETPVQWGTLNSPVSYSGMSAVGNFTTNIPPFPKPVTPPTTIQFIVTSYALPSGAGTGYYYYDYIPLPGSQTFFRYGLVLSQASSQAASAAGVSTGPSNQPAVGCSFLLNFHQ